MHLENLVWVLAWDTRALDARVVLRPVSRDVNLVEVTGSLGDGRQDEEVKSAVGQMYAGKQMGVGGRRSLLAKTQV